MDGILIVNKPKNYTSHDVVAKVKKICHEKVGHTGTLDPMATGVLPLLLGQGTKLSKYLVEHDKIYIAKIQLGKRTDTLDNEGKIIEEKYVDMTTLNKEKIINILETLKGKQIQTPPIYSAIKVNGKKLYEYARKGEEVEIPKREIEIYNIELLNINKEEKTIQFKVHCSKGTYIRAFCETIAEKLGTIGYMEELNRIKVGTFEIGNAITVEELEENIKCVNNKEENLKQKEAKVNLKAKNNIENNQNLQEKNLEAEHIENNKFLKKHIITMQQFFEQHPVINLSENKLNLFLNGVQLTQNKPDGLYQIQVNNKIIGVGTLKNKLLKREIIY